MKKLIAVAALATLAACGGDAEDASEAEIDETIATQPMSATNAGTYTSTAEDGSEVSVTLAENGTYTVMQGGDMVEAGTWEDNDRGTCLTAEGGDGEDCWSIQPGVDGMMDVTDSTGETMSYNYEG